MDLTTGRPCKATTKAGRPCRAYAVDGSGFCYWHDPAHAAERAAARAKGGRARHGRTLDVDPTGRVPMGSLADVMCLVELAVNDALRLENSIARARTLGYLAGVAIKAIESAELEERVAALEEVLKK